MRYGFLGPETTFTHQALLQALAETPEEFAAPEPELVPFSSVATAATDLLAGAVDALMAPIENSVEGGVSGTLDVLAATDSITIVAEQTVQITFVLAAREATPLEELTTVSSHPHAQAQVQGWLRSQVPHANIAAASSTAAAARDLAAMSPQEARGRAAVCSPLAAQHFGLEVLAEGIEDHAGAITRFVLVTREGRIPARTGADKTTLVVQLPHNRSGALLEALEILSSNGVNMSRIESRPIGDFLGRYSFSLDIEGHIEDRRVSAALRSLHRLCPVVHYLGSYPRVDGQRPEVREDYADHAYDGARDWVERLHTMITPTDPSTVI
ncbi:prephenate dehydratase [Brachybacterium faecium DSM 4810]|uniref:Prephenate dehydratase n=1 Tax=Brachybacterium faecium (strain ATCC 43885 / DSM 4810 / JCM 11609 / LMG 19847 / NBRC 14762 / NCIMB 9860 / 6-10) TaxID=446465 RepID=C7MIB5_BRAFD|nr:prephenate dehydratase [Brachybacterium faecium]ACU84541.1 prephenate dehydratase [Brachybacterium faecium DSM 4810]